jgi:hypothetical protein
LLLLLLMVCLERHELFVVALLSKQSGIHAARLQRIARLFHRMRARSRCGDVRARCSSYKRSRVRVACVCVLSNQPNHRSSHQTPLSTQQHPKQGPNDAIFSMAIPIAFSATGAGIVVFGIYSFMFTESGN